MADKDDFVQSQDTAKGKSIVPSKCIVTWKIEDVSSLMDDSEAVCPKIEGVCNTTFNLFLNARVKEDGKRSFTVGIRCRTEKTLEWETDSPIYLEVKGEISCSTFSNKFDFNFKKTEPVAKTIFHSEIIKEDILHIVCEFFVFPEYSNYRKFMKSHERLAGKTISNNFRKNLSDFANNEKDRGSFETIKIITNDGSFFCHKAILAARSPILDLQLTDSTVKHLNMKNEEHIAVKGLLDYLYFGDPYQLFKRHFFPKNIDYSLSHMRSIMDIGERFKVKGLKNLFETRKLIARHVNRYFCLKWVLNTEEFSKLKTNMNIRSQRFVFFNFTKLNLKLSIPLKEEVNELIKEKWVESIKNSGESSEEESEESSEEESEESMNEEIEKHIEQTIEEPMEEESEELMEDESGETENSNIISEGTFKKNIKEISLNYCVLSLEKESTGIINELEVHCSIHDSKGKLQYKCKNLQKNLTKSNKELKLLIVKQKKLIKKTYDPTFMIKCELNCRFPLIKSKEVEECHGPLFWYENNHFDMFFNDLGNLYEQQKHTDLTLKVKINDREDERLLKAHKIILSARSSKFMNLIKETTDNTIEILVNEYEFGIFDYIMRFIYTDSIGFKFEEPNTFANEVYKFSKRYSLVDLMYKAREFMTGKGISIHNAHDNMILGIVEEDVYLQQETEKYMTKKGLKWNFRAKRFEPKRKLNDPDSNDGNETNSRESTSTLS